MKSKLRKNEHKSSKSMSRAILAFVFLVKRLHLGFYLRAIVTFMSKKSVKCDGYYWCCDSGTTCFTWVTSFTGFADPLKVCCGYHVNYDHVWCGSKAIVNGSEVYGASCANPSQYVSWDGVHYSQAANQWFANHILNGSLSDPPIPIIQACQRH